MKKILIINGHPDKESLCTEFAKSYKAGAEKSSADCTLINLIDLNFDPILYYGYRKRTELEPDLLKVQQDILNKGLLIEFFFRNLLLSSIQSHQSLVSHLSENLSLPVLFVA
jgi:putative NADPH-quinone reductase